jgi:hypothetical protein
MRLQVPKSRANVVQLDDEAADRVDERLGGRAATRRVLGRPIAKDADDALKARATMHQAAAFEVNPEAVTTFGLTSLNWHRGSRLERTGSDRSTAFRRCLTAATTTYPHSG